MAEASSQTISTVTRTVRTRGLFLQAGVAVGVILLFLSLLSFHPDDAALLGGGIGAYQPVHNWIGRFGALLSVTMLSWLGLAAFAVAALLLLCTLRRLLVRDLPPTGPAYAVGLAFACFGASMFLGIFPDLLEPISARLNLSHVPGGAFGQRLCAPATETTEPGWMAIVVNPTGSAIISAALVLLGLAVIWRYDWHESGKAWWARRRERLAAAKTERERKAALVAPPPPPPPPEPIAPEAFLGPPPAEPAPEPPAPPLREVRKAPPARAAKGAAAAPKSDYRLPPIELLKPGTGGINATDPREVEAKKQILQETLESFGIDATVGETTVGPRVTLFEIRPAPGVKVERISSLANNIAMNLKAESLRILTPIPGKDTVGIEVPNQVSCQVALRELLETTANRNHRGLLPIALGKNISGQAIILDLARAPHLLIAGATGSGKSVCINTIVLSLLYRFTPDQLKLIMVDPKVVEFACYKTLPHLVTPVVSDVKKVPIVLRWAINQMEWRYRVMSKVGVRNIESYNARKRDPEPVLDDQGTPIPEKLPFVVVIIDELADIMMTSKADVETSLARIAQLARAVGIHAIIATQRPSVNVITGVIKANFPTRIAFQVSSVVDARTIMDTKGAEALLGRGDMLFKPPGGQKMERTQGALVSDEEIERVVQFCSAQAEPQFVEDIYRTAATAPGGDDAAESDEVEAAVGDDDGAPAAAPARPNGARVTGFAPLAPEAEGDDEGTDEAQIKQAIEVILRDRRATTSHLQRRLRIGYNRASLIIEELERRGVVGPQLGQNPREILITGENLAAGSAAKTDAAKP